MTAAHSTDPTTYRPYVLDVTKVAPDHQACYEYATCVALLQSGKKIKFVGLGSPFIFNQYHRTSGDFGAYSLSATSPAQLVEQIPASSLAGLY